MTLEEKAEQFADNIGRLELTCSLLSAKDKSHAYRLGRYEGYLAGATGNEELLERAKELIEDMYDKIPSSHSEYYKDVMERARQFLKEIEK